MERGNSTDSVQPESTPLTAASGNSRSRKQAGSSRLTEWQQFFLERLDYMLNVQRENRAPDEASAALLSKAVYSTYRDCQTQGVGEEALQRIGASGASGEPSAN